MLTAKALGFVRYFSRATNEVGAQSHFDIGNVTQPASGNAMEDLAFKRLFLPVSVLNRQAATRN